VKYRYWPRSAKAAVMIAAVISILEIATLILLLPPALAAWRGNAASEFGLMLDESSEYQQMSTSPLSEESFANDLRDMAADAEYTATVNPFLLAFVFFGYLDSRGVPLDEAPLEELGLPAGRDEVITTSSDTWGSLAEAHMGDSSLWPLLMALNYHRYVKYNGSELRENQRILVPRSLGD